jgi:hypothetical protein
MGEADGDSTVVDMSSPERSRPPHYYGASTSTAGPSATYSSHSHYYESALPLTRQPDSPSVVSDGVAERGSDPSFDISSPSSTQSEPAPQSPGPCDHERPPPVEDVTDVRFPFGGSPIFPHQRLEGTPPTRAIHLPDEDDDDAGLRKMNVDDYPMGGGDYRP